MVTFGELWLPVSLSVENAVIVFGAGTQEASPYIERIIPFMEDVWFEFASATDAGLVRAQNEDALATSPSHGLAILADGMGGYNAGEVASRMAVEVIRREVEAKLAQLPAAGTALFNRREKRLQQILAEAIQLANTAIFAAAQAEQQYAGMGTTLVVALFQGDKLSIAHVGDSRAYRMRGSTLVQLTRDHSFLQEQIDAGILTLEQARISQNRNLVTRAVGVGSALDVELHDHALQPGDLYLLCSDGLTDMIGNEEIREVLSMREHSLATLCDMLVQRANCAGGRDNISVILVHVPQDWSQDNSLLNRFLHWVK